MLLRASVHKLIWKCCAKNFLEDVGCDIRHMILVVIQIQGSQIQITIDISKFFLQNLLLSVAIILN